MPKFSFLKVTTKSSIKGNFNKTLTNSIHQYAIHEKKKIKTEKQNLSLSNWILKHDIFA
jgi:hypothetical protein